ncbi:MAG: biotin carboxylase N-terminal domain-containing protein, partial [Acidimicrobiales bacterium]
MRLLIANRGEIARRVLRTAHALGHSTVAVYADPDAMSPFVHEATLAVNIGPASLNDSYLSIERILGAATETGADAIHPGYGFLSENAEFARAVIAAGLIWVGPSPEAIGMMGSKIEARRLATAAGVPVIRGYDASQGRSDLAGAAQEIGYPVLVKASAGGGGKGIRIAHSAEGFDAALDEARAEAERFFGDNAMIVEKYIERPRHIEVQVVGDKHGNLLDLGTRECSVQRRYQKLLEEAPAPNLADGTRTGIRSSAVQLARSIDYDSAGTVEFIVDDETGDYFFLEMNTRLQVEHPVTELITGLDLVELQIRVAAGEHLPIGPNDVTLDGHAIEVRINAEDPSNDFAPQIGTVWHLAVPTGVRWDSGIDQGTAITPHYDPMVAKLIVHGDDRAAALARLAAALDELLIGGLVTNTGFQRWLIDQPEMVAGRITTRFLDETPPVDTSALLPRAAALAAELWARARAAATGSDVWSALGGFRTTPHATVITSALEDHSGHVHTVTLDAPGPASLTQRGAVDLETRHVVVNVAGQSFTFRVLSRSEHWAPKDDTGHGSAGAIVAPFPALVTEVAVAADQQVSGGDPVLVLEAMK